MTVENSHYEENSCYIYRMTVELGLHSHETRIEISSECNPKMFAEHEQTPTQHYIVNRYSVSYWDIDHIMPIKIADLDDPTYRFILENCLYSVQNGFAHIESLFAYERKRALEKAPT